MIGVTRCEVLGYLRSLIAPESCFDTRNAIPAMTSQGNRRSANSILEV